MKVKDCEFGGEFQGHIKVVYEQLLLMVTCAEVNSAEWNYAWDLLRVHIDHFKYRQMELQVNQPQMLRPQAPLQCCQN